MRLLSPNTQIIRRESFQKNRIMKPSKLTAITAAFAVTLLLNAPRSSAQDGNPAPPAAAPAAPSAPDAPSPAPSAADASKPAAPAAPSGDRGEQFRQRMNERLKAALKVTDDEWSVIQPLLEKVQIKLRESGQGRFGFGGRRGPGGQGGPGGSGGGDQPATRFPRTGAPDADALITVLEDESTSPDTIKAKLQVLRDARKKATVELEQAREDLRKVLTLRQEAAFVLLGFLE